MANPLEKIPVFKPKDQEDESVTKVERIPHPKEVWVNPKAQIQQRGLDEVNRQFESKRNENPRIKKHIITIGRKGTPPREVKIIERAA